MRHITRAIEDDALFGKSLRQIFRRFSLTGSCRTSWGSAKIELQGSHKSHVALIGERCDNESTGVAQIFVAIGERSRNLLANAVVLFISLFFGNPVISELLDPFECGRICHFDVNHLADNVPSVHVNNNKRID